ncbi:Protein IMPACT [Nymphon striatum]|nr:Protein IMPACT [Nymphon striatum]
MEREMSIEQAGFRKGRGTRDQIANIRWIMERSIEYQQPIDEIEALSAIYGEDLIVENVVERNYAIKLKSESHSVEVLLQVKLPENYPSCAPPTYQLRSLCNSCLIIKDIIEEQCVIEVCVM